MKTPESILNLEELFMGGNYKDSVLYKVDCTPENCIDGINLTYINSRDYPVFVEKIVKWAEENEKVMPLGNENEYEMEFPSNLAQFVPGREKSIYQRSFLLKESGLEAIIQNGESYKTQVISDTRNGRILLYGLKKSLSDFFERPFSPKGDELYEIYLLALEQGLINNEPCPTSLRTVNPQK